MITVRISPTIANEYANRCPEHIVEAAYTAGVHDVTDAQAHAMLSDAEYNSDKTAQTVGPYDMPLPVFNAYRALAKQLHSAIDKAAKHQEAQHTPGAWVVVERCSRLGQPRFMVSRDGGKWDGEWMRTPTTGLRRVFLSEAAARAAIVKAGGAA